MKELHKVHLEKFGHELIEFRKELKIKLKNHFRDEDKTEELIP
jgi:hypothetical protein